MGKTLSLYRIMVLAANDVGDSLGVDIGYRSARGTDS